MLQLGILIANIGNLSIMEVVLDRATFYQVCRISKFTIYLHPAIYTILGFSGSNGYIVFIEGCWHLRESRVQGSGNEGGAAAGPG